MKDILKARSIYPIKSTSRRGPDWKRVIRIYASPNTVKEKINNFADAIGCPERVQCIRKTETAPRFFLSSNQDFRY